MNTSAARNSGHELRKRRILGAILLSVALLAIVHRYVPFRVDHLVLPLLGVGFIVWAVVAKNWGLLIPGCIVAGVGVGNWVQRSSQYGVMTMHGQALFLYCVAGGFLLISVLSFVIFRRRELWPFWPAVFIGITGLFRDGIELADYVRAVQPYWPFALLAVAAWLLISRPRGGDKS